jgi:hypothetical protein
MDIRTVTYAMSAFLPLWKTVTGDSQLTSIVTFDDDAHVFCPTSAHVHQRSSRHADTPVPNDGMRHGMRRLERRSDSSVRHKSWKALSAGASSIAT